MFVHSFVLVCYLVFVVEVVGRTVKKKKASKKDSKKYLPILQRRKKEKKKRFSFEVVEETRSLRFDNGERVHNTPLLPVQELVFQLVGSDNHFSKAPEWVSGS
jgi:hypothetical protein